MIKRKVGLLAAIAAFVLTSGFQQPGKRTTAQSWIEFQSKEGAFSVLMPGQPEQKSFPTDTEQGPINMNMFSVGRGNAFYAVIYSDFPLVPDDPQLINNMLDKARDMGVANAKGRLLSETRITLGDYPGREIKISISAGILLARLYAVKHRLYQVMVAGTQEAVIASPDTARFLDSFKLVKRQKA